MTVNSGINPHLPDEDFPVPSILIHQDGRLLAAFLRLSPLPRIAAEDFKSSAYLAGFGDFTPALVKNKSRSLPPPISGQFYPKIDLVKLGRSKIDLKFTKTSLRLVKKGSSTDDDHGRPRHEW